MFSAIHSKRFLSLCVSVDGSNNTKLHETIPGLYKMTDFYVIIAGMETEVKIRKYNSLPSTGNGFFQDDGAPSKVGGEYGASFPLFISHFGLL